MQKNDINNINLNNDYCLYACAFICNVSSCKIPVISWWRFCMHTSYNVLNSLIRVNSLIYFIPCKFVMKFELSLDQEEFNEIQKKETVWFLTEQLVIKRQRFIEVWKMMDYYTREYDKLLREIDYLTNKIKKKHEW